MGDYGNGHYEWSPVNTYQDWDWETGELVDVDYVGGYDNETVTLTLSGLPKHSHIIAHVRHDAYGGYAGPVSSMSGKVDGATLTFSPSRYDYEEYWYQSTPAVRHEGTSATLEFTGVYCADGWRWSPAVANIYAYFPTVNIGLVNGTTTEDSGSP